MALGFDEVTKLANNIGGWFSNVGNWLVDLGKNIGNYLIDLGKDIGKDLVSLGTKIGGFFSDLGKGIVKLGETIGGFFKPVVEWLGDLFDGLGKWFGSVFDWLGNILDSLGEWFADLFKGIADIFKSIGEMLDYINPFSKKFFLYLAIVPDEGYFQKTSDNLKAVASERFNFFYQAKDAFGAVREAVTSPEWQGFKAKIPLINKEVTVISPVFVVASAGKMKAWIGGIIVLVMSIYVFRRTATVIGAGR